MSAAPETTVVPVATEPIVPQSAGPTEPSVPAAADATVAPADVKVAEDAPVAAVGGTTVAAGTTSEQTVDSNKAEVIATPITSGILGYKAPGLITQLKPFKKQYFWLGDEAIPAKDLHQYLRGTKPDVAHPVAAWASQTGKGLLFFSKDEKKGAVADAIALADVTYITKEGTQDLSFRYGPKKHQYKFQAATQDERNGWVVAVTTAHEQAKKDKESVESTEAYKQSLKELKEPSKAATGAVAGGAAAGAAGAAAAAASKDSKETPKEATKEAEASKETPKEAAKETEAAKKDTAKERSQSRKRASIFGGFGKKKEEKVEEKEEKAEEKAEKKEAKEAEKAEKKEAKETEKKEAEESKVETAAVTGGAAAATAPLAAHAEKTDKVAEEKATEPSKDSDKSTSNSAERSKSKRRSGIFGLFDKKAAPEKKEEPKKGESKVDAFKEDSVAAPDHKETSVKKEETKPIEAFKDDPVAPEAAKKENVAAPVAAGSEKVTTPGDKEKRRSSFFGGLGSKFGSVRNKQPKEAKPEEAKPAAVAESKTEEKADTVPAPAAVEIAPVIEAPKEEPKAIGDVVPEAVSIGHEQTPAATNGAATAPVVTTSA